MIFGKSYPCIYCSNKFNPDQASCLLGFTRLKGPTPLCYSHELAAIYLRLANAWSVFSCNILPVGQF
ncbi:unnamed protein product [Moneuplotes crassus]|uniref:Uncharacterized protein n=1 Tax=Euplotes crassus TaxID=5936 RepID=A0AAD1XXE7_EUPCR|nr:unnamed protein product [Moneuplotes crassus]